MTGLFAPATRARTFWRVSSSALCVWRIGVAELDRRREHGLELRLLDVLGDVDHDRSRPAAAGEVEGLLHDPRELVHVHDEVRVLHDGSVIPKKSVSWKAILPMNSFFTWPVIATSGTESMYASAIAETRFVAPGPLVAMHTPTLPVARA